MPLLGRRWICDGYEGTCREPGCTTFTGSIGPVSLVVPDIGMSAPCCPHDIERSEPRLADCVLPQIEPSRADPHTACRSPTVTNLAVSGQRFVAGCGQIPMATDKLAPKEL